MNNEDIMRAASVIREVLKHARKSARRWSKENKYAEAVYVNIGHALDRLQAVEEWVRDESPGEGKQGAGDTGHIPQDLAPSLRRVARGLIMAGWDYEASIVREAARRLEGE